MRVAVAIDAAVLEAGEGPEERAVASVVDSAEAAAAALGRAGHRARVVPLPSAPLELLSTVASLAGEVEAVFNLVESLGRRSDGEIAAAHLLSLTGVPVTGAPPRALSLCLDKPTTRAVLAAAGVPIPRGGLFGSSALEGLPFPRIVKPPAEDASHGIDAGSVVGDASALEARAALITERFGAALVEEYVPGREIQVALVGRPDEAPEVLSFGEIDYTELPADLHPILTYEAKWEDASESYRRTPAIAARSLSASLERSLAQIASDTWRALGLGGYARVDLRVHPARGPFVIDVNPNPDLSPGSGLALAAARSGRTHDQLVLHILDLATSASAR